MSLVSLMQDIPCSLTSSRRVTLPGTSHNHTCSQNPHCLQQLPLWKCLPWERRNNVLLEFLQNLLRNNVLLYPSLHAGSRKHRLERKRLLILPAHFPGRRVEVRIMRIFTIYRLPQFSPINSIYCPSPRTLRLHKS